MVKIYDLELPCGCWVAEETFDEDGNTNGDGGLLPTKEDMETLDSDTSQKEQYLRDYSELTETNYVKEELWTTYHSGNITNATWVEDIIIECLTSKNGEIYCYDLEIKRCVIYNETQIYCYGKPKSIWSD